MMTSFQTINMTCLNCLKTTEYGRENNEEEIEHGGCTISTITTNFSHISMDC
jgi:hypothetical protein